MYWPITPVAKAAKEKGIRALLMPSVFDRFGSSVEEIKNLFEDGTELITFGISAHSIYGCNEETLKAINETAKELGIIKGIHIAETRKERADCQNSHGVLPIEYLEKIGWLDEKTLLVHSVWITKEEIKLIKKYGSKVAHCPVSNMKLASGGVMPLPEMIESGVTVGLGTDSVASNNNLDMFEEMKVCGLLHKHHRWDATTAPLQKIMDMATIDAAKAIGMDTKIGSIEVGKEADIITVSTHSYRVYPINNVLSSLIYSANGADVMDVIIAGKQMAVDRKWV